MMVLCLPHNLKKIILGLWSARFYASPNLHWCQQVEGRVGVTLLFRGSLFKTLNWFLIVIGLISKSLKYSYKQLLMQFLSPLSALILPSLPPKLQQGGLPSHMRTLPGRPSPRPSPPTPPHADSRPHSIQSRLEGMPPLLKTSELP